MSNKIKTQTKEFKIDYDKPHPRLDAVKSKINKLLGATVANYIPEACDELRKDWFPTMSDEVLKQNPAVQEAMREEIYNLFAKERTPDGVWKESAIDNYFRPWLRYSSMQEGTKGNLLKANEAKQAKIRNKYLQKLEEERQKQAMDKLANKLPEPPKEPEPEFEYPSSDWSLGPSKYHKLGEDTKTPLTKLGDIRDGCRELFTALTEEKYMPALSEDLENDFIKPTREYRKFIYELDEHEQAGLYNWLVITQAAITDMLNILDEAKQ